MIFEFSKVFKGMYQEYSTSKFTKGKLNFQERFFLFQFYYSYISILESNEILYVSPPHISRHAIERQETNLFSGFLKSIREALTHNEISQVVKVDLQRILAWFIVDYFVHNVDLI